MPLFGQTQDRYATHDDVERLRADTNQLRADMSNLEERLRADIRRSETNSTRWTVGIGIAIIAAVLTVFGPLIGVLLQLISRLPVPPPAPSIIPI